MKTIHFNTISLKFEGHITCISSCKNYGGNKYIGILQTSGSFLSVLFNKVTKVRAGGAIRRAELRSH